MTDLPHRALTEVCRELDRLPAGVATLPVVVVVGEDRGLLRRLRRRRPDLDVRAVRASPRLHRALAAHGPCAAIIDVSGARRWRARLAGSFFHVAPGGCYLMRLAGGPGSRRVAVGSYAGDVRAGRFTTAPGVPDVADQSGSQRAARYLADALGEARVQGGFFVARQRTDALLKLHEADLDAVVATGHGADTVTLEVRAAARLSGRARVTVNRPPPRNPLPAGFEAPACRLRVHRDVTCLPRQVVVQRASLLPATFRRPQQPRLRNSALIDLAPDFARRPEHPAPRRLRGAYYHLDSEITGHFGHALTEVTSRLWGWRAAREARPDLKVLVAAPHDGPHGTWFYDLLAAAGIAREDVVTFRGDVRVEELLSASPMYSIGDFAHPDLGDVYADLGERLAARASRSSLPARVFFTRAGERRGCRNKREVEALFVRHGFEVVLPETLSLPDQVAMVRRADAIAGFAGSNLLQLGFCGAPKPVIVVMSDTYHVHNEWLLSSLVGHDLTLAVCRADVPRSGARFDGEAYRSRFAMDMDAEGPFVDRVLAGLG